MKEIILSNIIKSFDEGVIFNNFSHTFNSDIITVIKGKNGSGKSTLLKILTGILSIDEGKIEHQIDKKNINPTLVYRYFSYCSPYIELPLEFTTLKFFLWLHKSTTLFLSPQEIITHFKLEAIQHKELKKLSSGMYQRVKLIHAFMLKRSFLILDEPCVNFDLQGVELYNYLIHNFLNNRLLVIASNDSREFNFKHADIFIADN